VADHTQTITNTLTPVGIGEANIWNVMLWGDHWGSMADAWQDVNKGLDMADLSLAMALGQDVTHLLGGNTLTLGDAYGKDATITIINAVTFTEDIESIIKQLGDWDYIFPLPTTDGQDKLTDGFTRSAGGDDNFSKVANGSDNWS